MAGIAWKKAAFKRAEPQHLTDSYFSVLQQGKELTTWIIWLLQQLSPAVWTCRQLHNKHDPSHTKSSLLVQSIAVMKSHSHFYFTLSTCSGLNFKIRVNKARRRRRRRWRHWRGKGALFRTQMSGHDRPLTQDDEPPLLKISHRR